MLFYTVRRHIKISDFSTFIQTFIRSEARMLA